jgi:type VII secretion effector (TIGR04197 family)
MKQFQTRWQEIGFVPFKEKDKIALAYKEAINEKFPKEPRRPRGNKAPKSEKERLIAKYNALEQDITTYENNIGFFSMSKNSEPLVKQMQERIEQSKAELKSLADKIRQMDAEETQE